MRTVHQPIQIGALPSELDHECGLESGGEQFQGSDGQAGQLAVLDAGDDVPRQLRMSAEIGLAPLARTTQGTDGDRHVGPHPEMMPAEDYRRLTRR